ncbi:TonB-dependent receptor [Muriicola soli]|uniref:TonB-dependent receptor n=1 Tax=Muriicola soli TaxID=2507538 RepID=A0A411ECS0_9FLAO|nr:TonB-dependent receptor [Muriicola soli]QBA65190.1 TonB-dependent receptor [Muriicola soli]
MDLPGTDKQLKSTRLKVLMLLFFTLFQIGVAQEVLITGRVIEYQDKQGLEGVRIWITGQPEFTISRKEGEFQFKTGQRGNLQLNLSAQNYVTQIYPLAVDTVDIHLGPVYLKRDLEVEKSDNLLTLTESDLKEESNLESNSGLLMATRDVFLKRAAFDFSQAFFRVRGYDSKEGLVLINGIPMNRNWDGRPQWNNWGGLNDVIRNQEFTFGLDASDQTFGGVLGTSAIDLSPHRFRPGLRISTAASNRTYRNRIMATYHTGKGRKGFAYSMSFSRRWAKEGFVTGTPYDAYSVFLAASLALTGQQTLGAALISAYNSRGRIAALTDEVAGLMGPGYNPYWGEQKGSIRTSRIRKIHEPLALITYDLTTKKLQLRTSIGYQWGSRKFSRIGYYNAPNPDPTYYRYLPSYNINSPIGANFIGAEAARKGFIENPQWPWSDLYRANSKPARKNDAAYIDQEDVSDETIITSNTILNIQIGKSLKIDAGFLWQRSQAENFARVNDLLGADQIRDIDSFSNTRNNLNEPVKKEKGDLFGYHYNNNSDYWNSFLQARFAWNQCDFYVAGEYAEKSFQRDGLFLNERFIDNSYGRGKKKRFQFWGIKSGLSYGITSRHWIRVYAYAGAKSQPLKYVFINPRENNLIVPNISVENIYSLDVNYLLRLPGLTGRFSAYYTRFINGTEINFFYVDSGVGSEFVQEVASGLDRLHKGLEAGLELNLSPTTKASFSASIGRHEYASDPSVTINFDTSGIDETLNRTGGNIDLGIATIKGNQLNQGPQTALSLGVEYRDPSYWWIGGTANYLANSVIDMAFIKRTRSFRLDPENGRPFPGVSEEQLRNLLAQESLPPVYLLNLLGGKSWLRKGKYISIFLTVSNVFNTIFKSGGYEQSRNGNYQQMVNDNLNGAPSFGNKYWYGFGRTFFLNLAISF